MTKQGESDLFSKLFDSSGKSEARPLPRLLSDMSVSFKRKDERPCTQDVPLVLDLDRSTPNKVPLNTRSKSDRHQPDPINTPDQHPINSP